jgi:hypothetical protein
MYMFSQTEVKKGEAKKGDFHGVNLSFLLF